MNTYLDTIISLVLIFTIFSVVTYVIQEIIAVNLRYRGKMLWKSLAQLMDGYVLPGRSSLSKPLPKQRRTPQTDTLFDHPQIKSLQKDLKTLPSYIPAANFALALMDIVASKAPSISNNLFNDFKSALTKLVNSGGDFYVVLKNLADTSSGVAELQNKIENWFNSYMDRVTGWYQAHTVVTVRLIALGVTLFFNLNIIKLTTEIANNSQLRKNLVGVAEQMTAHPETVNEFYTRNFEQKSKEIDDSYKKSLDSAKSESEKLLIQKKVDDEKDKAAKEYTQKRIVAMDSVARQLSTVHLPIGWKNSFWKDDIEGGTTGKTIINIFFVLVGWLIAAGCISMGAPFWFNLLMKLVNVRRAGVKPSADDTKRQ
jgi:hypothetical protein